MQYQSLTFFSDETLPEDDIDALFSNLEQLEPPPSLIRQILHSCPNQPSSNAYFFRPVLRDEVDSLFLLNEKRKLC